MSLRVLIELVVIVLFVYLMLRKLRVFEILRPESEAAKVATFLVTNIELRNETRLKLARREKSIYRELHDEIQDAREKYETLVSYEKRATGDYFEDALLRILAEGDPTALGEPTTGPPP